MRTFLIIKEICCVEVLYMGSWAYLPGDMLETIAEKLDHADLSQAGAVCKSWRSTYLEFFSRLPKNIPLSHCYPRPFGLPLLLLSCKEGSTSRKYATLNDERVCGDIFLPETANKWICGSSWGWLITTDIRGEEVGLLNPITKCQIKLPSLATFLKRITLEGIPDDADLDCFQYIYKAIISEDPTTSQQDCIVMAIVGNMRQLSYCKIGDEKWMNVEGSPPSLEDVIYSNNKFYVATQYGVVASCDGNNPNSGMTIVAKAFSPKYHHTQKYLVVSSGRLLQVSRSYEQEYDYLEDGSMLDGRIETVSFKIFGLVKRESPILSTVFPGDWVEFQKEEEIWHDWVPVENISDQVLLLGNNGSLSLPSRMYNNCRRNQIHFTDHHFDRHAGQVLGHFKNPKGVYHDIGIFDIVEKSVRKYHPNDPHDPIPSIWFTPNPW